MKNVIEAVSAHYNAIITECGAVKFSKYDSEFCITDGRIYAMVDDRFCSSGKVVKSLAQVEAFVEAHK